MTEKKEVQAISLESLSEDDLRRIIREVLRTELRHIVRDELGVILGRMPSMPQEGPPTTGTAPVSAAPGSFSVRPAGVWGTFKNVGKRVGQAALGVATVPATGMYGGVTGDWRGFGWSTKQTVDGIAGSGTYNQVVNAGQRITSPIIENAYNQWGGFCGWHVSCGNCKTYFGVANAPAGRVHCQCGAINVW